MLTRSQNSTSTCFLDRCDQEDEFLSRIVVTGDEFRFVKMSRQATILAVESFPSTSTENTQTNPFSKASAFLDQNVGISLISWNLELKLALILGRRFEEVCFSIPQVFGLSKNDFHIVHELVSISLSCFVLVLYSFRFFLRLSSFS